ncbi:methyl-accepting chemotaxis protein [Pandoraea sp. PE-S2R-1]|uniref:methyl-accepting chemotaxis protein n=1 Tax=Pandoraea sp. PE-S2R-1 TaxID=1986994 RepID=UPI000B401023
MYKNMTIRTSLTLVLGLLGAVLVLVSVLGLQALSSSNESLSKMATDDTPALAELKGTGEQLLRTRLSMATFASYVSLGADPDESEKVLKRGNQYIAASDALWNDYLKRPKEDTHEAELAKAADAKRRNFFENVITPAMNALKQGDVAGFHQIQARVAPSAYNAVDSAIRELQDIQIARQKDRFEAAQQRYNIMRIALGVTLVIALLVALWGRAMLARAVLRPIREAIGHFERMAAGDLSHRVEQRTNNEMGQLFGALGRMRDGIAGTVGTVRESTEAIHGSAREIADGNADLSARTESQASSLEQTAASMEELTAVVKQNAENARAASQLAVTASETASRGGEVVQEVVTTMRDISEASQKVNDILTVIDGIAFQTNILALNAAVEAARAGEQGRGFAVVAGEVRTLAQRSAAAAKEIKGLIDASGSRVETGTRLVERAGATMIEVVQSVKRVTDIMGEISAASVEQSSGIEQVNGAVTQMDEMTQQNAALVEEASAAAAALESQAARLRESVALFRLSAHDSTHASIGMQGVAAVAPSHGTLALAA